MASMYLALIMMIIDIKLHAFVALIDKVAVGRDRTLEFIFRNGMKHEYTIAG